jgi:hypothetical protein
MVEPLADRSILSCQFYDLLCDDASPERRNRRNLGLTVKSHVFYQLLIDSVDFELLPFYIHLRIKVGFDQLFHLPEVFFIERARKTMMFGVKLEKTVQDNVELFWNSKLLPVRDGHFFDSLRIGTSQTLLQIIKPDFLWHFDFNCNSSFLILPKGPGISNSEAFW